MIAWHRISMKAVLLGLLTGILGWVPLFVVTLLSYAIVTRIEGRPVNWNEAPVELFPVTSFVLFLVGLTVIAFLQGFVAGYVAKTGGAYHGAIVAVITAIAGSLFGFLFHSSGPAWMSWLNRAGYIAGPVLSVLGGLVGEHVVSRSRASLPLGVMSAEQLAMARGVWRDKLLGWSCVVMGTIFLVLNLLPGFRAARPGTTSVYTTLIPLAEVCSLMAYGGMIMGGVLVLSRRHGWVSAAVRMPFLAWVILSVGLGMDLWHNNTEYIPGDTLYVDDILLPWAGFLIGRGIQCSLFGFLSLHRGQTASLWTGKSCQHG